MFSPGSFRADAGNHIIYFFSFFAEGITVKRLYTFVVLMVCALLIAPAVMAAKKGVEEETAEEKDILSAGTFTGLQFRALGPAIASGRISEIAVDPRNPKIYYVAVSSGGVWKTVNSGTTWTPIFDNEGSYSIGTVAVDPNNPLIVWVGGASPGRTSGWRIPST
jgi:hypothetical protein